ncbi:hypothetical protein CR162_15290 [Pseudoroseomonas rhizosphaerae]|uniref:Uncharacterized protein n=1 Tax=Teichococcus rhizosphaerae TaxID=1335062 RepID=A0A2C7A9S1_9PROT|nr:hypothetical protein [Pseudoroseomonas rhizosphaerae]PHK94125.1 hypothetical protein CR162_15290 [Pseudoroseomonas rhizosphaerae]
MSASQASTKSFDLVHHLLTTRSTGRIAEVAMRLRKQERILPIVLKEDIATFPANMMARGATAFMLKAVAGIWMPTKCILVQLPLGTGALGVFAEVREDGTVDVFRLQSDGVNVRDCPFTTHLTPADPRPVFRWDRLWAGKPLFDDGKRWGKWAEASMRLTCHDKRLTVPAVQRWAEEAVLHDLFALALALSLIGTRSIALVRPDGSNIPMDGGHA